jgi:hypothetical protein
MTNFLTRPSGLQRNFRTEECERHDGDGQFDDREQPESRFKTELQQRAEG